MTIKQKPLEAAEVCGRLSKAIQAVAQWHDAQKECPLVANAAIEMFLKSVPERKPIIDAVSASALKPSPAPSEALTAAQGKDKQ